MRKGTNFVEGWESYTGSGNPESKNGIVIYGYACDTSMSNKSFYNSDGDLLIVP